MKVNFNPLENHCKMKKRRKAWQFHFNEGKCCKIDERLVKTIIVLLDWITSDISFAVTKGLKLVYIKLI